VDVFAEHGSRRTGPHQVVKLIMFSHKVMLTKTISFDSVQDGSVAVFTPHTAFQDPTTSQNAPLRESIELRALVFYDD